MTPEEIEDFFEVNNDDYIKFEAIPSERRLNQRPDLNAFLLLDRLAREHFEKNPADPEGRYGRTDRDMICCSEHDEFYLDIDLEQLEFATEEELRDLIRCGIMVRDGGLSMFA